MARNVLTSDTASAPASSAARANEATSVTLGVSLGMTGRCVALRTAVTTRAVPTRLQPNWMPPSLMLGQEMLSSMAATPSASRQHLRHFDVLVDGGAADVDEHARAALPQQRQLLVDEAMHADALQADGVDHAGRRLDNARRRVPLALGHEQPLHAHAAERREVGHLVVLEAVAEAAAGGNQRVGQRQRADADGKITSAISPTRSRPRRTPGR